MNNNSQLIYSSLLNAEDGQDVYEALSQIPSENLIDIANMIGHVMNLRDEGEAETLND